LIIWVTDGGERVLVRWSRRSRAGWLVSGVVVALSGLALLLGLANEVRYELGYAGKPGQLRITSCRTTGSGKTTRVSCAGVFTLNDGTVTDEPHSVDWDLHAEDVVAAQRQPNGSLSETGWKTASFAIGGALFGLMMVGLGVHGLAATSHRFPSYQPELTEHDRTGPGRHSRPSALIAPLPQPQRAFSRIGGTVTCLGLLGAVAMFCVGFAL
jgi:hypothetical protein